MSTDEQFDLIVVGTGPSSSFFLKKYVERFGPEKRILILERGTFRSHADMVRTRDWADKPTEPLYVSNSAIEWLITPSFGGNSNYWLGDTPRFVPADFETASRFGQGSDWPISYADIEPDYVEVERVMGIAGSDDIAKIGFRSAPYPQPAHNFSEPDRILKEAYPDTFFAFPTARASRATDNRPACCNTNYCSLCPVDAKFRVLNELRYLFEQSSVEVHLNARVRSLETAAGNVTGVNYIEEGQEKTARGDLVVLGTNPIFNSEILLRTGDTNPFLGRGLATHSEYLVTCLFDGLESFQGGTIATGISYELYTDEIRKQYAGCFIVTINEPFLRPEYGRWRQALRLQAIFDDVAEDRNYVDLDPASGDVRVNYEGHSEYAQRGRDALDDNLARVLSVLPIEEMEITKDSRRYGAHLMCTHRMGTDPATSVVDPGLVHHRYRNLLVLGGGSFVTPATANPTLTMAALSNRAAKLL